MLILKLSKEILFLLNRNPFQNYVSIFLSEFDIKTMFSYRNSKTLVLFIILFNSFSYLQTQLLRSSY